MSVTCLEHLDSHLGLLITGPRRLGRFLHAVADGFHVSEREFGLDRFNISDRIYVAADVDHVFVFKTADNLKNRIDLPDVTEEFIAQSLAVAGPFDDAGDVHQFQHRGDYFLRHDVFGDPVQSIVGHADHAFVRFDGAKRIVFAGGGFGQRQCVKQSAFANVRESNNSCFHGVSVPEKCARDDLFKPQMILDRGIFFQIRSSAVNRLNS